MILYNAHCFLLQISKYLNITIKNNILIKVVHRNGLVDLPCKRIIENNPFLPSFGAKFDSRPFIGKIKNRMIFSKYRPEHICYWKIGVYVTIGMISKLVFSSKSLF